MAFQFPWTNFHELNLDWFLSKFKQFTNNFLETTATAESVPYGTQPTVTVTGGELDDDTDIVDPFTFNFKIPAGQQGEQGEQGVPGVPGQDGFSPIATVTKSGSVATITITDVNGTTTTTISDGEVTQAQLDTKAPIIIDSASGSVASFTDGVSGMVMHNIVADIDPMQDNTYGNPYPAGGGVNLLDPSTLTSYGAGFGLTPSISGDVITLSGTYTGTTANPSFRTLTVPTHENWSFSAFEITTTGTINKLRWNSNSSTSIVIDMQNMTPNTQYNIQFKLVAYEVGTPAPGSYVPYKNICPITGWTGVNLYHESAYNPTANPVVALSWQTEAGTVYGGTINFTTGVLTVDTAIVTIPQFTGSVEGNGLRTDITLPDYNGVAYGDIKCNMFATAHSYAEATGSLKTSIGANYQGVLLLNAYVDGAYITSLNDINALIPVEGCVITYPIATPQTYQLTPQQLTILSGTNCVWSDTGNTTVTYPADTKLYIERLTQPAEDDMTANTTIANGKFFMIGNNLYRATTTIANGSQIIPGTNATALSLADALNLL